MVLSDYLVPMTSPTTNICFDCQRACGDCSWSELNPDTGLPRFEPVPGWTAKRVYRRCMEHGKDCGFETYFVTECPLFVPDDPARQVDDGTGGDNRRSLRTFY